MQKQLHPWAAGNTERGVSMVILAVAIVAFMALIGLAIDSSMLSTTHSQYRHAAEYAAVGALERYLAPDLADPSPAARLLQARQRAEEIVGNDSNLRAALGSGFFRQPLPARFVLDGSAESQGRIVPGSWDREAARFTEIEPTEKATALRVELRTSPNSPLKTLFMTVVGHKETAIAVSAIASATPIHLVTIVDLSHTATYDTYWKTPYDIPAPIGRVAPSEYALEHTTNCASPYRADAGELSADPRSIFNGLEPDRTSKSNNQTLPLGFQFRDDYTQCATVPGVNRSFSFNTETPPEPLVSYLTGVNKIFEQMERRQLAADPAQPNKGDLVGFLGVDSAVGDTNAVSRLRTLPLSRPVSQGADAVPEFRDFQRATAPLADVRQYGPQLAQKMLFPVSRYFNLDAALKEAHTMLSQNRDTGAQDVVVLFTAGISNCAPNGSCAPKDRNRITDSYREASRLVRGGSSNPADPSYLDPPISLNVILGGTAEGASTLMAKFSARDPRGRDLNCLTDSFARQFGHDYVNPSFDPAMDSYFFESAKLYDLAAQTRGLFFPLRVCCSIDGCSCASAEDLRTKVDFQRTCQEAAVDPGKPVGRLSLKGDDPVAVAEVGKFIDNASRFLCDPFGRNKPDQAIEAVQQILAHPVAALVQEHQ